jgi:two-component system sensor histidine kinase KdpD
MSNGAMSNGAIGNGAMSNGASAPGRPHPAQTGPRRRGLAAPYALPAGLAGLLFIGATAAGTHGGLSATWVLVLAASIVAGVCLIAEPAVTPLVAVIGWLTVVGFSRPPYAQLRPGGPLGVRAALVIGACGLLGAGLGALVRRAAASFTLWIVETSGDRPQRASAAPGSDRPPHAMLPGTTVARSAVNGGPSGPVAAAPPHAMLPGTTVARSAVNGGPSGPVAAAPPAAQLTAQPTTQPTTQAGAAGERPGAIRGRRRLAATLLAIAVLPLLTVALAAARQRLSLDDDLLIYLVAVVAVAVVGGFWPAVLAAVAASSLLNWYFTPPLHTFTIEQPQNLLALLLFVTVAVTVSSVVHLAARRAIQAARSGEEAACLLALAQTVLGGADTPAGVLDHLTGTLGGRAELLEQAGGHWISVAASGSAQPTATPARIPAGTDLALVVAGQSGPVTPRLLDGFAAQAAAALDRERLRIQAAQAEVLAAGNRMRTALLAAVSHDLRTPLASIKASVSTLRQADVEYSASDEAALLAAIEAAADRLDALIGNLLDMSRLNTGSLQPFLRPTSIDEVAPAALRGLDGSASMWMAVPDRLPLVRTDPGLLERVLANLFANALGHSPPDRPPGMRARRAGDTVLLEVTDHGPGVPDALKTRMFEPFERLEDRGAGTGVGLGLAVAKGFAEAMGAAITAADTPGGGLTMEVALPVADSDAGQPAGRPAAAGS